MENMKYRVELTSCGNIDRGENPFEQYGSATHHILPVNSIEEAQEAVLHYIKAHNLGSGNWSGGSVWTADGECVGNISYNGSFRAIGHEHGQPATDTSLDDKISAAKARTVKGPIVGREKEQTR